MNLNTSRGRDLRGFGLTHKVTKNSLFSFLELKNDLGIYYFIMNDLKKISSLAPTPLL